MPSHVVHVGLPYPASMSAQALLDELSYWTEVGYRVSVHDVVSGDRAGAGKRFFVNSGMTLVLSYAANHRSEDTLRDLYRRTATGLHVALAATPGEYEFLRRHVRFERETEGWTPGTHSIFHVGPFGLEVEYVFTSVVGR